MLPMKNYKALFLSIILLVFSAGIISADEYDRFPPPQSLFIAPSIDQIWNPYNKSWESPKNAFQVNTVHEIESGNSQKPIQNMFSGDHGHLTIAAGKFNLGGLEISWDSYNRDNQWARLYMHNYGLRVRGHYIPDQDRKHACDIRDGTTQRDRDDLKKGGYTSYISPYFPVNTSGTHSTEEKFTTMEEWNSGIYGNGKAEDAYKEATGFWSESAGQMARKQTDDKKYRSILVFGTQESNCYAGPLFVTGIEDDTEDRVIVALDFKKTFRKENIDFAEVEYWVYYKNLEQDIDHQIANSPIYCDPREAHKYGSGMWSGPVGEMIRKEITAGYANECLGIAFEFFPPENANSSNIFKVNQAGYYGEVTLMTIGLGSDDWIELEFDPLRCGNEMRDSGRIQGGNRRYLEESETVSRGDKYNPITTYPYRLASANQGGTGGILGFNEYEELWRIGNMISNSGNTTQYDPQTNSNKTIYGDPTNYCFLRDYIHNEAGSDPWQRLIDPDLNGSFYPLYDNEFVPYGAGDISPMYIDWESSPIAVMGRNGKKTANTSKGCDRPDPGCTFSNLQVNLSNEFGNKIRDDVANSNTLRHIIYVDGTEASFPAKNVARKAWFYTNTHKVSINFRMDALKGVNLPPDYKSEKEMKEQAEKKWDAILNSMMIIPVQPESRFMNEKLGFMSSYVNGEYQGITNGRGFFYTDEEYEWVTRLNDNIKSSPAALKVLENIIEAPVIENIIEAPIIEKPLDIASKATSLFSGNKEEEIDTSLFDASEQAVLDRERQLQELEEERRKLEQESANRQDDLEFQREMQRLELEAMRAELELEREKMELEIERQNLENQENMRANNKEFFSEDDRGFFSKPKAGTEKTGGGFEDIASDPTKLAMLGLVVTLGTTLLQMFRGN